jgi:alpha-tubulin suppressor-like RCC1 family protein
MFLMRSQFHRVERMLSTTVAYSWGIGTSGELGHANFKKETSIAGDIYVQITPRKILKSKRFTTFAVGSKYSIALDTEGRLFHWGQSPTAKFQSNEPTLLDDSVRYKKISCGPTHAAAIDADGSVYTWGSNGSALFNLSFFGAGGYLGHGNTSPQEKPKRIEFLVKYGSKAEDIVCGGRHTVIRTVDGELLSCGIGEYGELDGWYMYFELL